MDPQSPLSPDTLFGFNKQPSPLTRSRDSTAAENDTSLMSPSPSAGQSSSPFKNSGEGSIDWLEGLGDINWELAPEDTGEGSSKLEPDLIQYDKRANPDREPHQSVGGNEESNIKTPDREQLKRRLALRGQENPSVGNNVVIDLSSSGHYLFSDKSISSTAEEKESEYVIILFSNFERKLDLLQGKYRHVESRIQDLINSYLRVHLGEEKFLSGVKREYETFISRNGAIHDAQRKAMGKFIQKVYKDSVEFSMFQRCIGTQHPDPHISSISLSTLVKFIPKMKDIMKRYAPRLYEILDLESSRLLVLFFSIRVVEYSINPHLHAEPFFENLLLTCGPPKSLLNLLENEETKKEIHNIIIFKRIYMPNLLNLNRLINIKVRMHIGIKRFLYFENVNPAFQNIFLATLQDQIPNFTFYDVCDLLYTLRYDEVPFYDDERQVYYVRQYHTFDRISKYRLCDIFNAESKSRKITPMSVLEADTWSSLLPFMQSECRERFIEMCYKLIIKEDYEVSEDFVYSKVQYLIQAGIKASERVFIERALKIVGSLTKLKNSIDLTSPRSKFLIMQEDTADEQLQLDENDVLEYALQNFMSVEGEPLLSSSFKNFISTNKKGIYDVISFKCLREENNPYFVENWIKIMAKSVQLFQSAYVNDVIETIYFIILCFSQIVYFDQRPVTVNYKRLGFMKRSIINEALLFTGEKRDRIIQNVCMWRYIVPFLGKVQQEQIHMLYEDAMYMHIATDSYEQRSTFVDTLLRDYISHTWRIGGV